MRCQHLWICCIVYDFWPLTVIQETSENFAGLLGELEVNEAKPHSYEPIENKSTGLLFPVGKKEREELDIIK